MSHYNDYFLQHMSKSRLDDDHRQADANHAGKQWRMAQHAVKSAHRDQRSAKPGILELVAGLIFGRERHSRMREHLGTS